MDQNEIAQRLNEVRERIRAELEAGAPPRVSDDLPDLQPPELKQYQPQDPPGEPNLHGSEFLQAANDLAVITAPITVASKAPVIGPLLTLLRRLARPFVQPFLDPYLARQEKFNAEVIRHLNVHGERTEARLLAIYEALYSRAVEPRLLEARLDATLSDYHETLRQRHVVLFDALEEELWALRARVTEGYGQAAAALQNFDVRFVERAQAVDARFDEKDEVVAQLADRVERVRDLPGKTEMFETRSALAAALEAVGRGEGGGDSDTGGEPFDTPLWQRLREWMNDQDYRAHQASFRGNPEEIGTRLTAHVERFRDAPGPVADLGCGRGEFLSLLSAAEIDAIGVEINEADVEECVERGLTAVHADLFEWLEAREPESLGGVFLAQVIEHLPPPEWARLFRLAVGVLRPGGLLVVETINPESMFAILRAYVLDPTHVRPVHPQLLAFLAGRAGFESVDVHLQAEVPEHVRPLPISRDVVGDDPRLEAVVDAVNERLARLDELCCQPQEYAIVATRRPA